MEFREYEKNVQMYLNQFREDLQQGAEVVCFSAIKDNVFPMVILEFQWHT